jgi:cytochrome P450
MTDTNLTCPVVRIRDYQEALRFDRSRSIVNAPEMFAGVPSDPVNGDVNVREFLAGSVVFIDGADHRDRRKMLNRLIRPDALIAIREDMILPAAHHYLLAHLTEPDGDGCYRADLVDLCHRTFLRFTAKLIGLVGIETEEGLGRLSECAGPIAAGTSSQFLEDRPAINEIALAAKARYVEEFYLPSRRKAEDLLARVASGEWAREDVPVNIMTLIVEGADPAYRDEQTAIIETTMMFAASVGTSTQSIIHTIEFLDGWFQTHPEDLPLRTDRQFLLNALQETIRLRAPFSPYNTRMAAEECDVAGHQLRQGQEVHIERVAANRDTTIFGDDADEFNPRRPTPNDGVQRFGIGFGSGAHQCFGLRVVLGIDGSGGAHVELLRLLYLAGIAPDRQGVPADLKKNMDKFSVEDIPRYTSYPVLFRSFDRSATADAVAGD